MTRPKDFHMKQNLKAIFLAVIGAVIAAVPLWHLLAAQTSLKLVPIVPALINAIHDATGHRFRALPVTANLLKGVLA